MVDTKSLGVSQYPQPIRTARIEHWGLIFLAFGFIALMAFLFAAILSKLLPQFGNRFASAVQNDRMVVVILDLRDLASGCITSSWYYCFLVPLTLPVLVVAVYFHWLSMKLFKHA